MLRINILLIVFTVVSITLVRGQKAKPFEGVIIYEIKIEGDDLDPMAKSMFSNMEQTMCLKKEKSRSESDFGFSKSITISDSKTGSVVTLSEIMGQKFMIKLTPEDLAKQDKMGEEIKINYLDETKVIAGYTCKKALVISPDSPDPMIVFYTTDIPATPYVTPFKGIAGLPLEYDGNMGGIKMKTTVKSIKSEKVPNTQFDIPEGYQETTVEELQNMFEGGIEE